MWARTALKRSIRDSLPPEQLRQEVARWAGQDRRDFKVTREGVEPVLREWSSTMSDAVAEGEEGMPDSVLRWASAVLDDLEQGNDQ